MNCRHCQAKLEETFLDLGFAPPSNAYLAPADLNAPEITYPLRLRVCTSCWLVQTEDYARADEIFSKTYAYFSSTSRSWLAHARAYSQMVTERFGLGRDSFVLEVASNDGYLLRNFVEAGIPCLGIEPTQSTAEASARIGVPVEQVFFGEDVGRRLAREGRAADLIAGNNVYAHVPDINDFTRGLAAVLKPEGVVTLEFPHLMRLVEFCQFDTVYHEHFSYLSLLTVSRIFAAAGLRVFDVEELSTHGGSLRVYGCRAEAQRPEEPGVAALLATEGERGLDTLDYYEGFQPRVDRIKDDLLRFLLTAKAEGKSVAAYGAAAKGNTLLNYAGVRPDLLPFVCDAAEAKQGHFMPGSHIPILAPDALRYRASDYIVVLPWNIRREVLGTLRELGLAGSKAVTFVPTVKIDDISN